MVSLRGNRRVRAAHPRGAGGRKPLADLVSTSAGVQRLSNPERVIGRDRGLVGYAGRPIVLYENQWGDEPSSRSTWTSGNGVSGCCSCGRGASCDRRRRANLTAPRSARRPPFPVIGTVKRRRATGHLHRRFAPVAYTADVTDPELAAAWATSTPPHPKAGSSVDPGTTRAGSHPVFEQLSPGEARAH